MTASITDRITPALRGLMAGSDVPRAEALLREELSVAVNLSAAGFAADVERYLNAEAVQACPPSTWYRLRKTVRRHKVQVLTAVAVAASIGAPSLTKPWSRSCSRSKAARQAAGVRGAGGALT